jgi:hypothetical protein
MKSISNWFFRLAACYIVLGVGLGIVMAASGDHSLHPVHAHINLLGFVLPALFACFYRLWPEAAGTRLAAVQFWLFAPAQFVLVVALWALYRGFGAVEPVLGAMSVLVGLSLLCFLWVVWKHTGEGAASSPRETVGGLAPR